MLREFRSEAGATMPKLIAFTFSILCCAATAQPAALEVGEVFSECNPVYAASSGKLVLYKKPDLESQQVVIPYQAGWKILAPKREGLTRVLRVGTLKTTAPDPDMFCRVAPDEGPGRPIENEMVEYLYYVGEGFGEIRFRGAECQAEVDPMLKHFELIRAPEVQLWLKVFFGDGTSPGWMFFDGTQTEVVDVEC